MLSKFKLKTGISVLSTAFLLLMLPLAVFILQKQTIFRSKASTTNALEPERGTLINGATLGSDTQASNGQYIQLGVLSSGNNFQPTAPYYASFYYPWFKNSAFDGSWSGSTWNDADVRGTHTPPANWFSNYLPNIDTLDFDPAVELYSSNDFSVFKWQVGKMAEAKQEVAISSWWGPGHKTDAAFNKVINDFANRADNPYPNLRWALYYECEGNGGTACGGTSNPSVSKIVSDLNYIASNYANKPGFLKVNNKPVLFVYGDSPDILNTGSCTDPLNTSVSARWKQANSRANTPFYIVLKVYSNYRTDPCQPDSWHQYAPSSRTDSQGNYSFMVSPGFWRSGDAPRLCRNLNGAAQANCKSDNLTLSVPSFQSGVQSMVNSTATWRLIETWNEWGEGSAVEPGFQVVQTNGSNYATENPNGTIFDNAYIDVLKSLLPPLEQGGGSALSVSRAPTSTPTPSPFVPTATIVPGADPIIAAVGDIACGTASTSSSCYQMETSNLALQLNPFAVLVLGDTQYEGGAYVDYMDSSSNLKIGYNKSWGRLKEKTYPAVGNHEYGTSNAQGYFDYFNGIGQTTGRAGDRSKGYYAYNIGSWRLYALNSNCAKVGGCGAGSPQEQWFRNDLQANPKQCTLIYMHHPLWGSQLDHVETAVKPLYQAFYDNGGDLVLTGHIHFYERFAPMDPNGVLDNNRGLRQIIVGTGGRNTYGPPSIAANSLIRSHGGDMGILKLTLHPSSYEWKFLQLPGQTFTDSGTSTCH